MSRADTPVAEPANDVDRPPYRTGGPRKRAPSVALAVAAGATLVTATLLALLPARWPGIALGIVALLLAPSARGIDRRLVVNLSLALGLAPLLLWLPTWAGHNAAWVYGVAIGVGATTGAAVRNGPTILAPTVRRRDAAIGIAGTFAALISLPLSNAGRPDRALSMLSTGLDHGYHFTMFLEHRLAAIGSPLLAANADASGFAFSGYPQWFHRMLTVLAQGAFGDPSSAPVELIRYAALQWACFILLAVLMTAALLQALPDSTPPLMVVPAVAIVWSLVLGVPGAINLIQGHLSFLLAASAPVVLFLLLVAPRRLRPVDLVASCALVILSASWVLLLPLAAAAAAPVLLLLWERLTPAVRWIAAGAAAATGVAAFALFVLPWLNSAGLEALTRDGTVPKVALPVIVLLLLGCPVLVAGINRRAGDRRLLRPHVVVLATSAVPPAGLAWFQVASTGQLSYYFWKLALGSLVVSVVVTVHAVVTALTHDRSTTPTGPRARFAALAVTLLAAIGLGGALQEFTAPSVVWAGILPSSIAERADSGAAGDVDLVLDLAASTPQEQAARSRLLATRPRDMNTGHALVWFHALSHSSTHRAMDENTLAFQLADNPDDVALGVRIAQLTLAEPDRLVLVTDARLHDAIMAAVPADEAKRVVLVG